jgi:hypothetical protein
VDRLASWVSTGDQIASMVGAAAAVVAVLLTIRGARMRERSAKRPRWPALGTVVLLWTAAVAVRLIPGVPRVVAVGLGWSLAVLGVAVLVWALWRGRRRSVPVALISLARAQIEDEARHRYRFFDRQPPTLVDTHVRPRVQPSAVENPGVAPIVKIDDVLAMPSHMLLVGGAGAGKSALVAVLVADSARTIISGQTSNRCAVAVRALDIVDRHLADALAMACERDLKVPVEATRFTEPPVAGGRWDILIDGLDEIIDAGARGVLLSRLSTWVSGEPKIHRFLITSRPLATDEMHVLRRTGIAEYELRPFDRDDLARFAGRWFTARYPTDQAAARAHAARFLARVAGARLGPVARIPLLASIAAVVYERADAGVLPTSRAALYDRFVEHLLDGRRELSEIHSTVRPRLLSRGQAGAKLAAWLDDEFHPIVNDLLDTVGEAAVSKHNAELTAVACQRIAAKGLGDLATVLPDGRRFVRDLLFATGVFVMNGDELSFAHQSFAEFFAARCLAATADTGSWRRRMADPATRSFAAFAVARRPDADRIAATLLSGSESDPVAAGTLVADGVPMAARTRTMVINGLVAELRRESARAPECLAMLRDLSIESDVLDRLTKLVNDDEVNPWTRVVVADAVADVDRTVGIALLRTVVSGGSGAVDNAVRRWAIDALNRHGADIGPVEWAARVGPTVGGEPGPIGSLARQMLTRQALDDQRNEDDRIDAAIQLADNGDLAPLRALVDAPEVRYVSQLRAASAIADRGDPGALLTLSSRGTIANRYGAAVELHWRGVPASIELLRTMAREGRGLPLSYGAAARLAELGELQPLVDLATWEDEPPGIAMAAARLLADRAGVEVLEAVVARAPDPRARAWALTGLVRHSRSGSREEVHKLLNDRRIGRHQRFGLTARLAAAGDEEARKLLRRGIDAAPLLERLRRAVALAELGDPLGPAVLGGIARSRRHRTWERIQAAAELAGLDEYAGTAILTALTGRDQPAGLRLAAAIELAYHFSHLDPLVALVVDGSVPARYRVRALESVRKAGTRHIALVQTERVVSASAVSRLFGNDLDASYPPLPEDAAGPIAQLAYQESTPPRLRIAAAVTSLPREAAANLLETIAGTRALWVTTRATAAARLTDLDPARGLAAQRAIIQDRHIPRIFRWITLLASDLLDLSDFSAQRKLLNAMLEGGWQGLPRLAALAFIEPDPAPAIGEVGTRRGVPE